MTLKIDGGHLWALNESLRRALNDLHGEELKKEVRKHYDELCARFSLPPSVDQDSLEQWTEEQWREWAKWLEENNSLK
ncbi:MAG: hypothetical protein U1D96_00285 [Eubacteriales bacterium]|nr:hypothetical protein [Bacillota bacterium]MBV1727170.1 hypothetical protein [Desulforudis sp.]MDP3051783.1 hypothetical protein [Eubacteriales bacterium]MDQ7789604.1 hypothetical protein [Clostridia bacterium]MBU4533790.1 hypothetical protein [Bacillota bacterium]